MSVNAATTSQLFQKNGNSRCSATSPLQPGAGTIIFDALAAIYSPDFASDIGILAAGVSNCLERGAMGIANPG